MAVQDVVYKLSIDTSGAQPQFDAIKQAASAIGEIKPKIDTSGLTALNSQFSQIKDAAGKAFDFSGAKGASGEVENLKTKVTSLNSELAHTGEHQGALTKLKEGFGDLGGILTGGLFAAGAVGLEKIFDSGEKRIKSLEDYTIALRQSGVGEENLAAAQKAGAVVTDSLSDKYARSREEIRAVQTQVAGLGGISGEQAKKVTEIGLAFEQLGVPAKAFKAILAGSGSDEAKGAIQSLGEKVPSLRAALEGAATAGQKVDAVFKGLGPTLAGMKEAADGPLGSIDRIKNQLGETLGKIGTSLIQILDPVLKIITPIVQLLGDTIGGLVSDLTSALAPLGTLFKSAGADAGSFLDILKPLVTLSLLPVKASIEGVTLAIKGIVAAAGAIGGVISDIGNFLGLTSDIDNANTHAAASVRQAKSAFEEYEKSIGDANAKIAESTGLQDQVTQLDALQKKTSLTADEQKKLGDLTRQLGDKFPEATAGVNAQTGAFEVNIQKLKELTAEQKAQASDDYKHNIEENIWKPTKDLIPALDAQKAKLGELRQKLDEAIKSGDKDKILEVRDAYNKQKASIDENKQQLEKNIEVLVKNGIVGKGSAEEIAKGMGISKAEAEKLVPVVAEINNRLEEEAADAKKVAESVAGMAAAFDNAAKAQKAQHDQLKGAIADTYLKESQLRDQLKNHQITKAQFDEQNAQNEKTYQDLIKKTADLKRGDREIANADASAEAEVTDAVKTTNKEKEKAVPIAEQLSKLDQDRLTALLTEQDQGKLTVEHTKQIAGQEIAGLRSILSVVQAEEIRVGKLKQTTEVQKELLDLNDKEYALRTKIASAAPILDNNAVVKLKDDLASLINQRETLEIKLGIAPPEEILSVIDTEMDQIKEKLAVAQAKLIIATDPVSFAQAGVDYAKLNNDLLSKQIEFNDKKNALDKELRESEIALIDDEKQRQRAQLELNLSQLNAHYQIRLDAGKALSAREIEMWQNQGDKIRQELAKLSKDVNQNELDLAKIAADGITKFFDEVSQKRQALSRADLADRELGYDKDLAALKKSYSKGEISAREYNTKLAKFTQDRTAFEAQANQSSAALIEAAGKIAIKSSINAMKAKIAEAIATALVGAVSTLGPIGLIEFAAVAGLGSTIISGIENIVGLASGGVLINEMTNKPEIISPFKEFSEFASQIITDAVQTTKEELQKESSRSGGGGLGGRASINIGGEFKATGRTMRSVITKERLARKSEITGPAETIYFSSAGGIQ